MESAYIPTWDEVKEVLMHIGGPAIGGILGYTAAAKKNTMLGHHLDAKSDAIQLDAITRHFEALVDGYEKRIQDLTKEVEDLREEVKGLRKALDQRPRIS